MTLLLEIYSTQSHQCFRKMFLLLPFNNLLLLLLLLLVYCYGGR
jgi:hypothetical protein